MTMAQVNFSQLFQKYEKGIYNYVLRMVQDRVEAEDLTQEVFVKVYKGISDFRGESAISTWLYRIATNLCLDHFRKKSYKQKQVTDSLENPVLMGKEELSSHQSCECAEELPPDESVIKSELKQYLYYFMHQLSEDYRVVIVLSDLQGLKNREIAEILGCSLETVKIRLHRARKQLKEALETCCTFYYDKNNNLQYLEK